MMVMGRNRSARCAGVAVAVALGFSVLAAVPAVAATFCVSNSTQLQDALNTARLNNEDDTIRISTGTYTAPTSGFTYFDSEIFGDDDHALDISGGWVAALNSPCLLQLQDPLQTVLDGSGTHRVMDLVARDHTSISIRLVTFADGYQSSTNHGVGLAIESDSDGFSGTWTIERDAFINNDGEWGAGLYAHGHNVASTSALRVVNNLFLLNHARSNYAAAELIMDGAYGVYLTNNTVLNNVSDEPVLTNRVGGIYMSGTGTERLVANNNFWNNDKADLWVDSGTTDYYRLHNNFELVYGSTPVQSAGNISVVPVYQSAGLFRYVPVRGSQLVDAGVFPALLSGWYLASHDLVAGDRTVGTVDIGAYENERIFADGFEPASGF